MTTCEQQTAHRQNRAAAFLEEYPHAKVAVAYMAVYLLWFFALQLRPQPTRLLHCPLDAYIPFCEWFFVPYFLWYGLLAGSLIWFLLHSREDFLFLCFLMFSGMTVALAIYTVFPAYIAVRQPLPRENLLCLGIELIRRLDPPQNVCPSMHVSSTLAIWLSVRHSQLLQKRKALQWGVGVLSVLICVGTLFIQQHSVIDVAAGAAVTLVLYPLACSSAWKRWLAKPYHRLCG